MILEVIGGKGRVDRCPGASARADAAQRAQRCGDAALIIEGRVCSSPLVLSLWSLIGVLSVSVIPLVSVQNSQFLPWLPLLTNG